MATTMKGRSAGIRYILPAPGTPESERVLAYRHRKAVVRHLETLIAAGRFDQAVSFALPVLSLIETAPVSPARDQLLHDLAVEDAREDIARAEYLRNPDAHRRSYLSHIKSTIRKMAEMVRQLEDEEDARCSPS